MSIVDYASLQASVASWIHRTDLTALIPDFIMLAESNMQGDLNARAMEARTTLTCTPGLGLASRLVTLPNDMLEMRRLLVVDADPAGVLKYKSPDQLVADNPNLLSAGRPVDFTVIAGSIELSPPPDSAYPLELIYQQRIPSLSTGNPTNWLILQNPSIYLWGTLLAAMPFTQDDARLNTFSTLYAKAKETINSVDWYSGSTMTVRAR